jgi:hypothetical protein
LFATTTDLIATTNEITTTTNVIATTTDLIATPTDLIATPTDLVATTTDLIATPTDVVATTDMSGTTDVISATLPNTSNSSLAPKAGKNNPTSSGILLGNKVEFNSSEPLGGEPTTPQPEPDDSGNRSVLTPETSLPGNSLEPQSFTSKNSLVIATTDVVVTPQPAHPGPIITADIDNQLQSSTLESEGNSGVKGATASDIVALQQKAEIPADQDNPITTNPNHVPEINNGMSNTNSTGKDPTVIAVGVISAIIVLGTVAALIRGRNRRKSPIKSPISITPEILDPFGTVKSEDELSVISTDSMPHITTKNPFMQDIFYSLE